jgi:cold shock CspA family protein
MTPKKPIPAPPAVSGRPMTGTILRLVRGEGSGYIRASDGRRVFFHRADTDSTFNDLEVGAAVTFEWLDDRVSGPRALRVRKTGS